MVDTLDVTAAFKPGSKPVLRASARFTGASAIAINGRVRLPGGILTPGRQITLYDQRGRVLGRVAADGVRGAGVGQVFEVNVGGGYSGVVVVR